MKELMTIKEVAETVRVHPATVRRWIVTGKLPFIKIGARYRIETERVKEMLCPNS